LIRNQKSRYSRFKLQKSEILAILARSVDKGDRSPRQPSLGSDALPDDRGYRHSLQHGDIEGAFPMNVVSVKTQADPISRFASSDEAPLVLGRRATLLGAAAFTVSAALPARAGAQTSLKMALTPSLNLGYEETGPATGEPILLLHGWPYDPRSFDEVVGPLAAFGCRVIVPYLRCFGPTVYRSPEIFRSGQQSALGRDVVELMDVLNIEKAILAGFDWGNRAACVVAALWPERVRAFVSVHGYTILDIPAISKHPGDAVAIRQTWYRWFMNAPNGPAILAAGRDDIARQCWEAWSPNWRFKDSFFRESAKSFRNPDWVDTTIHCYRYWYGNAESDPALQQFEEKLWQRPKISAPTLTLAPDSDPLFPVSFSADQRMLYTGHYERRVLQGVGHDVPAEKPEAFVQAVKDLMRVVSAH
jgi:pimeloyl-ACP methyl ester carboxylesterase